MSKQAETNIVATPRSSEEVEHIVVMERLHRYNHGLPCGAGALHRHLQEEALLRPVPSARHIGKILTQFGLTHGRTGWYKGDQPDWLPMSARVPDERRKHFSMTDCCQR
jgi:hypothetical protein